MSEPPSTDATTDPLEWQLTRLFRERLAVQLVEPDTDLFETGILDSLVFVDLLLGIEQAFGIHVDVEDMDLEAFRTPRAIVRWLRERGVTADAPAG